MATTAEQPRRISVDGATYKLSARGSVYTEPHHLLGSVDKHAGGGWTAKHDEQESHWPTRAEAIRQLVRWREERHEDERRVAEGLLPKATEREIRWRVSEARGAASAAERRLDELIRSLRSAADSAERHKDGGSLNSLGELQTQGPAFDVACAELVARRDAHQRLVEIAELLRVETRS